MDDELRYRTNIYTDIQGIERLRYDKDQTHAKKEVAQQFEALMLQMVFKSMRDATNALSSGLFGNKQMEIYEDMFDKQLSLMMSNNDIGFSKLVEKNIDQMTEINQLSPTIHPQQPIPPVRPEEDKRSHVQQTLLSTQTKKLEKNGVLSEKQTPSSSQETFVKKIWSFAKQAAKYIGTQPEILIAQAALETNWGKNILGENGSSHNLFNIKADADWKKNVTVANVIEYKNGILTKENAHFKVYHSYQESFMDYIQLLKRNERYHETLKKAAEPEKFIQSLHQAGYATDPAYSEKILKIFSSSLFQNIISPLKGI